MAPVVRPGTRRSRSGTARTKLARSFYARDALAVARDLLGLYLVHQDGANAASGASWRPRRTADRAISPHTRRAAAERHARR